MSLSNNQTRSDTPYTIEKIREIVTPIAQRFNVKRMWLFGSYARGDYNLDSDLDFRVDMERPCGFFKLAGLYNALEEALGMKVDLISPDPKEIEFLAEIEKDEVIIYDYKS